MVSNVDKNRVWQLELGEEVIAIFGEFMYEFPYVITPLIEAVGARVLYM